MYEKMIKEWLLSNKFRVYSLIASCYYEQLEELKPSLFRQWLARELQIEEEKISLNNLYAALSRQRRKMSKQKTTIKSGVIKEGQVQNNPKAPFPFSKDDELPQKQNIVEM